MPEIIDEIIERPQLFTIKDKSFYLYPVTLAKSFLIGRLVSSLGINIERLGKNLNIEFLRLVKSEKEKCCEILSYYTAENSYEAVSDIKAFQSRKDFFLKAKDEDIATLLIMALRSGSKEKEFIHHLGLDKEQDKMHKVSEIKHRSDKNSFTFGGKTIIGAFINPLVEMGYSKQEILYERSIIFLKLALADKVTSIFLSDEEMKKVPMSIKNKDEDVITPNKENMKRILEMDWK